MFVVESWKPVIILEYSHRKFYCSPPAKFWMGQYIALKLIDYLFANWEPNSVAELCRVLEFLYIGIVLWHKEILKLWLWYAYSFVFHYYLNKIFTI